MKFRAMNIDYHAEATIRWQQQQTVRSKENESCNKLSSFRLLVQEGSYEMDRKKVPLATTQHERQHWTFGMDESISPVAVVDEFALF